MFRYKLPIHPPILRHLLSFLSQDMASRFTLDSATEFLFGNDVRSLSAGLPYPPSCPQPASSLAHSSNTFSQAFGKGQTLVALRARIGVYWPLAEFWRDLVNEQREIVNKFIDPILDEAVVKNKAKKSALGDSKDTTEVKDDETLLDHLVNFTEGERCCVEASSRFYPDLLDRTILKDEIVNIIVAGRDTASLLFVSS